MNHFVKNLHFVLFCLAIASCSAPTAFPFPRTDQSSSSTSGGGGTTTPSKPLPAPSYDNTQKNLIGINFNYLAASVGNNNLIFADLVKTSNPWTIIGKTLTTTYSGGAYGNQATVDSAGWPTQDAWLTVSSSTADSTGTYHGTFVGQATVAVGSGTTATASIKNSVYHSASNVSEFDLVVTASGVLSVQFTNTKRLSTDSAGTGITKFTLGRPNGAGSATAYDVAVVDPSTGNPKSPAVVFTDAIVNFLKPFNALRFMDYSVTNSNPTSSWGDRVLPSAVSFGDWSAVKYATENYPFTLGAKNETRAYPLGGSYEHAILLCNQAKLDLWINVPLGADDAFVTNLANLIRNGDTVDGVTYPGLDSSLHVYVELSNEVWNGLFNQFAQNGALAESEGNSVVYGQSASPASAGALLSDGQSSHYYWGYRRVGARLAKISDLFRAVYGDADMPAQMVGGTLTINSNPRVRPVLAGQQGGNQTFTALLFIDQNYPYPPLYYFYGAGGSVYYSPIGTYDASTIWTSGYMDTVQFMQAMYPEAFAVKGFGLHRIAYEGGPGFDAKNAAQTAAWSSSTMTTTFVAHHDQVWSAIGGELAVYYESVGDVDWGFAKDIYQLNTPKMAALNQLFAANRAEPAIWNTPPVTLYGSEVDIANKAPTNTVRSAMILSYSSDDGYPYNAGTYGTATAVHMKKREYAFYGVRTTADGALAVTVSASVNTGGSLSVRLDGVPLGTVLPSNKAPVVFNIASVTKGLHTVAVVSSGADADLLSVAFQ